MKSEMKAHAPEEWLERYSMRLLTEEESESLEDHLMFCQWCQQKLESVESFLAVAREASRRIRQEERQFQTSSPVLSRLPRFSLTCLFGDDRPRSWFALPITAAAMACLALVLMSPLSQEADYQRVRMESFRGSQAGSVNATRPFELILNLDGLTPSPAYRVEIVNAQGAPNASSLANPQGNALTIRFKSEVIPGQYWVRVYVPGAKEPLREYSLLAN